MPYDEIELSRAKRRASVDAALKGLRGDQFEDFKVPEPPPEEPEELSFAAKYAPLAVRGIGGFIGSAPGIGALGSGGAELIAEGMENYFGTREGLNPWEIGGAAAIGAVGGGMIKAIGSAPSALNAAARSGALGATQPFIRSYTEKGELPEASDVALSTLLSAGTGGALGHFLGAGKAAKAAGKGDATVELFGSKGAGVIDRKIPGSGEDIGGAVDDMAGGAGRGYSRAGYAETPEDLAQLPKNKRAARQENADVRREQMDQERISKAEAKIKQDELAATEIAAAKAEGLVPQDSISESFSAPIPGGTERLSRRYVAPAEEAAEEGGELGALLGGKKGKGKKAAKAAVDSKRGSTLSEVLTPPAARVPGAVDETSEILAGAFGNDVADLARVQSEVIPPPSSREILSNPNAISIAPGDLQKSFGPGAQFSTATNSGDDLLGALKGMAERRSGPKPEVLPTSGLEPQPSTAPVMSGQRGAPAPTHELPADITQRAGYDPNAPVPGMGGGGQLAKMTEADTSDRFGAFLKATGRDELDLGAERLKNPAAFGTGVDAPLVPEVMPRMEDDFYPGFLDEAAGGQPPLNISPGGVITPPPNQIGDLGKGVKAWKEGQAESDFDYARRVGASSTVPMDRVIRNPRQLVDQELGPNYNELQSLFKAGQGNVPKEAARFAGRMASKGEKEAQAWEAAQGGATPQGAAPMAPTGQPGPATAPPAPVAEKGLYGKNASKSLIDFFKGNEARGARPGRPGLMGPSTGGGSGWGSEGGFADPSLLTHVGGAVAGGLIGGVANEDDPIMGALGGAAAGAALTHAAMKIAPHLPSIMSSPTLDQGTKQVLSQLGTPEGMKQAATEIVNRIPTTLRANLLWSLNLPNNAIVGPYGAGLAAATERHLAGDPRAAEFLKLLTPSNWGSAFRESLDEASRHIGEAERAGGHLAGAATNVYDKYTSLPGTFMHAGDLATRKLGIMAGFTEEEMKAFTMTAEPEFDTLRQLANIPRSGLMGQVIAPFMRTAANAVEQGSFRTPGLGYLTQSMRENPDAMNVQHIQQLLGAGVMGGGYLAGQNEEEISKSLGIPPSVVRAFARNVVGPYSVLSSAGYATGKAMDAGDTGPSAAFKGAGAYVNETPLPTLNVLRDYLGFGQAAATGNLGPEHIPAGIAPKGLVDWLNPEKGKRARSAPKAPRPQRPE